MTKISDTAAVASIGAATRELRLPVVRAEAPRLAEAAQRDRASHLGYLADGTRLGGEIVGCAFLMELTFLHGRAALAGRQVSALLTY